MSRQVVLGLFVSVLGKAGKLSYKAVVQGNGNLLIGKAYTAIRELQPGDEYEIKLGRKQIVWFLWVGLRGVISTSFQFPLPD